MPLTNHIFQNSLNIHFFNPHQQIITIFCVFTYFNYSRCLIGIFKSHNMFCRIVQAVYIYTSRCQTNNNISLLINFLNKCVTVVGYRFSSSNPIFDNPLHKKLTRSSSYMLFIRTPIKFLSYSGLIKILIYLILLGSYIFRREILYTTFDHVRQTKMTDIHNLNIRSLQICRGA